MSSTVGWIAGILAVSLLAAGGLWAWTSLVSDDRQPRFERFSVEPAKLRFIGGQVVVQANVTDDSGLRQVGGAVMRGNSQWLQLPVQSPSGDSREFTYLTEFQVPGNTRSNGKEDHYFLRLVAVDSAGQEAVAEAAFHVPAPAVPPPPPEQMRD